MVILYSVMTNCSELTMVAKDALLEGRGAAAATIANEIHTTFDACLKAMTDELVANHAVAWPSEANAGSRVIKFSNGRRFIKVIKGGSVWAFVEKTNGLVWKPKTYKAHETNFPRGCVFDAASRSTLARQIHGITSGAYYAELS